MSKHLPHYIDPIRFAAAGGVLAGDVDFNRMDRLAQIAANQAGAAQVELHFGVDGQGIRHVRGNIQSAVELICQRCLGVMLLPVRIEVRLGMVESEQQAERLPDYYDPLLVSNEPLLVGELVEEEILLALPTFPRHETNDLCEPGIVDTSADDAGPSIPSRPHPFTVLARLKSK